MIFITRLELLSSLKTAQTFVFGILLFAISFLVVNIFAGAFDSVIIMITSENNKLNSPQLMSMWYAILNMIGLLILAVNAGKIGLREFDHNAYHLTFTTPISKTHFLGGKFIAVFSSALFLFSCAVLGTIVATLMPYLDQTQFGPIGLQNYLYPFLTMVLPNVFFMSAIFLSLSLLFRNHFVNWMAMILLYAIYYGSTQLGKNPDFNFTAALLDPFGLRAINYSAIGLTSEQMNENSVTSSQVVLLNRIIWTLVGLGMLVLAYLKFHFGLISNLNRKIRKTKEIKVVEPENTTGLSALSPKISFGNIDSLKKFLFLIRHEWSMLFKSMFFKIIMLIGVVLLVVSSTAIGKIYDTNTYPIAYNVADVFLEASNLFFFVLITLFSGEMMWRERNMNFHLVGDALPVNNGIKFSSKIVALTVFIFVAHVFMVLLGIGIQYKEVYNNYELDVLVKIILGVGFVNKLFIVGLAFTIQAVVNNRFTGYFILLGYYFFQSLIAPYLIENQTFLFNSGPSMLYSDMNGFGYNAPVFILFKTYWFVFVLLLLSIGLWFLPQGVEIEFSKRFSKLKKAMKRRQVRVLTFALVGVFVGLGSFIFYNISVLNDFETAAESETKMVEYERNFAKYKDKIEPVVTDVSLQADLYPENGNLNISGTYWMKNKSEHPIQEVCVDPAYTDSIWFENQYSTKINTDEFKVFQFNKALQPGDSIRMHFRLNHQPKGFTNNGVASLVDKNGSFFTNTLLPQLGYNEDYELQSNSRRRKHGLKEKSQSDRPMDDLYGNQTNVLSQRGHINLSITASTKHDQTLIATGELVNQWTENNRNYFSYKTARPIQNFFAILSAQYEIARDTWTSKDGTQTVELSIFHHPSHKYNLENMMQGMKQTLTYCSENFAPYQYNHLRIVEFPRFATYAQSFPGMIPFSEGIGFIADLRDVNMNETSILNDQNDKIDYPFFVTAHEVAHQWWAHQVCAAKVEGSIFIIESLTQYTALMVMKKHYGEEKMRKFLARESFSYLSSRNSGTHREKPLFRVNSDEPGVYYRKGAVVMYALQHYIGEKKMNRVIQGFNEKYAFQDAPYPKSTDLLNALRAETPDSLKYIIEDWFDKITLYKNKPISASYTMSDDLEYEVNCVISIEKYNYNHDGIESKSDVNDYIPIAIFNQKGKMIYYELVKMQASQNQLKFSLDRRPSTLVIDPYNVLLDKNWLLKKIQIDQVDLE